jgi:hypothetical protein
MTLELQALESSIDLVARRVDTGGLLSAMMGY